MLVLISKLLVVDVVLAGPPGVAVAHEHVAEKPPGEGNAFALSEHLSMGDIVTKHAVLGEHEAKQYGAQHEDGRVRRPDRKGYDPGYGDCVEHNHEYVETRLGRT